MKIGIIGAGKAGTTIGKVISDSSDCLVGFYSRSFQSACDSANFTNSNSYEKIEELILASDTLFVTVPDGEIAKVWDYIAGLSLDLNGKIFCHFSGSLSSDVFSCRGFNDDFHNKESEVRFASFHPIFAFSNKYESFKTFQNVYFTAEGDSFAVKKLREFFENLGHRVSVISSENKAKYHAACVFASNLLVGLISSSVGILKDCGFDEETAYSAFETLTMNNARSVFEKGAEGALTGPVERNDITTVEKHLKVLDGNDKEIYRALTKEVIRIAKNKHLDRDYSSMMELIGF